MTTEQKMSVIDSFCNWLADQASDNVLEDKQESLEDLLHDYCCQLDNDDTFEDEYEDYESMANHVPEVINFLRHLFDVVDHWYD